MLFNATLYIVPLFRPLFANTYFELLMNLGELVIYIYELTQAHTYTHTGG